ncbi:unnamed protein product [Prorocentrum cordatum]|uniref:Uncharacterized protein n=1 Tax=Prorocentrum cordatum TaxID=2364126 RepID=A0ABN9S8B6_9DINO|nr:unnamed protein product [Polarella glacialis]
MLDVLGAAFVVAVAWRGMPCSGGSCSGCCRPRAGEEVPPRPAPRAGRAGAAAGRPRQYSASGPSVVGRTDQPLPGRRNASTRFSKASRELDQADAPLWWFEKKAASEMGMRRPIR